MTSAPKLQVFYGSVALGSVTGSLLRWSVGLLVASTGFPLATLFVNVTGSFAIGYYNALPSPGPRARQFVMTGICGGYTTFSMFSLETLRFLQSGAIGSAALYIGASLATWLVAVWLGDWLGRKLHRADEHPSAGA